MVAPSRTEQKRRFASRREFQLPTIPQSIRVITALEALVSLLPALGKKQAGTRTPEKHARHSPASPQSYLPGRPHAHLPVPPALLVPRYDPVPLLSEGWKALMAYERERGQPQMGLGPTDLITPHLPLLTARRCQRVPTRTHAQRQFRKPGLLPHVRRESVVPMRAAPQLWVRA
ncbi:hypothetical protein V5O48_011697 [Marasmius crinis-equi]|uniref:Uncharacterized protein n=1 Tax=Marasmius crinis-equi TaxID=585013 RepID=A0ABR3F4X2_9AGAR